MKTAMDMNKPTQWFAGMAAMTATLFTVGGPLALADHYAQTGAIKNPDAYLATQMAKRITCPNPELTRTAGIPGLHQARDAKPQGTA